MIAVVVVDVKHQAVDQGYDYFIPARLEPFIQPGQRVEVPFGNRQISGIVISIKETSDIEPLKPITQILDLEPVFSDEHLSLSEHLSTLYAHPRAAYLAMMLPPGMRMTYEKQLTVLTPTHLPSALQPIFANHTTIKMNPSLEPHLKTIKQAIEDGIIEVFTDVKQKQKPLTIPYVRVIDDQEVTGNKQRAILDYLKGKDLVAQSTLLEATHSSTASLNSLIKKQLVEVLSKETYRERQSLFALKDKTVTLNHEQETAYKKIASSLHQYQVFLLHGITSSGKTEIYIKLAEHVLSKGKTVLMMVPEISLTPALTARFKAKFSDVAVYHSRLTQGEQYDSWRRVKQQKASIMIGARSAIFAPMKQLGLIIMDEEHSDAYLQEDHPKYHARDLAILRAKQHQIPLLLGSATPSIESYYRAEQGEYQLLSIKQRALNSVIPDMHIIDMKEEFLKGNTSIFSERLLQSMQDRLDKNEQTLLLINRRGHANFILCRNCGQAIECDACDVTMTYHHHRHELRCHYCDLTKTPPTTCPNCSSPHIRYMGIGSERVELELKKHFPSAYVLRMDKDTTTKKDAHETLLLDFEEHGDFLVGTQMISKGLDFERVTLVGILSADMSLFVPDYHAKEETFSLLTQMAGRSGRRLTKGEVIIQAYHADHPVLTDVTQHDYEDFYQRELHQRQKALLPPIIQMSAITVSHANYNQANLKATELMRLLRKKLSKQARIIGPMKPSMARIRHQYRMHVIIKYHHEPKLLQLLNTFVKELDLKSFSIHIDHHPTML